MYSKKLSENLEKGIDFYKTIWYNVPMELERHCLSCH